MTYMFTLECGACGMTIESEQARMPCPRCTPEPIVGFIRVATPDEAAARWPAIDGYTIVVVDDFVVEPQRWLPAIPGRTCAASLAGLVHRCGKPAVATLRRAPNHVWSYCPEHLYGRRLVDGRLECMIRVANSRLPDAV